MSGLALSSAAVENGGHGVPAQLSQRAMHQLRDTAAPVSSARLRRLVGGGQPGSNMLRRIDDLGRLALNTEKMAADRAVLSTPSRRMR